jgi:hypothetical protein
MLPSSSTNSSDTRFTHLQLTTLRLDEQRAACDDGRGVMSNCRVMALLAGALSLAACGPPTEIVVTVELEAGAPAPQSLRVSVFDPMGPLLRDRPLASAQLPGVLTVRAPDVEQIVRIVVTGEPAPVVGGTLVRTLPGLTVETRVLLATAVADRDGDGVPDAIDVCPDVADPEQRDSDGDGAGDRCDIDVPFEGGTDGAPAPRDLAGIPLCTVTSVSTFSGSVSGYQEGPAGSARFEGPFGVAALSPGLLAVSDSYNHKIRQLDTAGQSALIAGGAQGFMNGAGAAAQLARPLHVTADGTGTLFIADKFNNRIRRIAGGQVSTLAGQGPVGDADGVGGGAQMWEPHGIAWDGGDWLYFSDTYTRIRRVAISTGKVETLAGTTQVTGALDGPAAMALFNEPAGLTVANGSVYIADDENHRIRRLDLSTMMVSTLVGAAAGFADGAAADARFRRPAGIIYAPDGFLYVSEGLGYRVRRVALDGTTDLVAGTGVAGSADGMGCNAEFGQLGQIAYWNGALYVADAGENRIRKIALP